MRPTLPSLCLLLAAATLPAAVWTGAGDGFSWGDPSNWQDSLPPGPDDPVWDIGSGASVALGGEAPGGQIIKRGEGTLRWLGTASAQSVEVQAGTFNFGDGMIWPEIRLTGGTVSGYILESEVIASGGTLAARIEGSLRLLGGPVMLDGVTAAYGTRMEGAILQGQMVSESSIWLLGGSSRIEGHLHLAAGSALSWSLGDSLEVAPLVVTGELSSDYAMWLYFGLVDWTAPYWDQAHDVRFIDAWEGGIVSASLIPDPYAGNEAEGAWSQVADATGDLILRWTPLEATPVPEASAGSMAILLALGAAMLRMRPEGPYAWVARRARRRSAAAASARPPSMMP